MRRRTAIKICKALFEPLAYNPRSGRQYLRDRPKWRWDTKDKAIRVGRRRCNWSDNRFPYIPSDEEQVESFGIMTGFLADALMPPEDAVKFKEAMWSELAAD